MGRRVRHRRAVGDVASIDAVRIAIGKMIVKSKCTLSFQFGTTDPYIQLSFEDTGKLSVHRVYIKSEELKEVKFHIAEDKDTSELDEIGDSMTVIAFRITPTVKNKLIKYTRSYDQDESDRCTSKRYISVELRDADDFKVRLNELFYIIFLRTNSLMNIHLFIKLIGDARANAPASRSWSLVRERI